MDVVGGRTEVEADNFAFVFRSGRLGKTALRRGAGLDEMDDGLGLMPRYFFVIGDNGSVNLWCKVCESEKTIIDGSDAYRSTRFGSSILYASNIFLLVLRTSGLASRAVARIIVSMSRARCSFSSSGGLKQFKQVNRDSTAATRSVTDLSWRAGRRCANTPGS